MLDEVFPEETQGQGDPRDAAPRSATALREEEPVVSADRRLSRRMIADVRGHLLPPPNTAGREASGAAFQFPRVHFWYCA